MRAQNDKVTVGYAIWSLGLGGAERVVIELARGLDRARFRPVVVCLNQPGPFSHELAAVGVPVVALDKRGPFDLRVIPRLRDFLRRERVDLLHTHLWGANTWGRIAARLQGVPTVVTEHNEDVWKGNVHRVIDRLLAPGTARVVTVSHGAREFYARWGVPERLLSVIHNGVDLERLATAAEAGAGARRSQLGLGRDDQVIGWFGRMTAAKDLTVLVDAFARLRADRRLVLLLVGDGQDRALVAARATSLGVRDRVIFTGVTDDVASHYGVIDLLALSSTREGHPVSVLEAMACGRAVVATAVGGVPEIIDDPATGRLVAPRDPAALAAALQDLLDRPDERLRIARAGRERVASRFSVAAMVRAHEALYAEVLRRTD